LLLCAWWNIGNLVEAQVGGIRRQTVILLRREQTALAESIVRNQFAIYADVFAPNQGCS
jgi:hypothetical protein